MVKRKVKTMRWEMKNTLSPQSQSSLKQHRLGEHGFTSCAHQGHQQREQRLLPA